MIGLNQKIHEKTKHIGDDVTKGMYKRLTTGEKLNGVKNYVQDVTRNTILGHKCKFLELKVAADMEEEGELEDEKKLVEIDHI